MSKLEGFSIITLSLLTLGAEGSAVHPDLRLLLYLDFDYRELLPDVSVTAKWSPLGFAYVLV